MKGPPWLLRGLHGRGQAGLQQCLQVRRAVRTGSRAGSGFGETLPGGKKAAETDDALGSGVVRPAHSVRRW